MHQSRNIKRLHSGCRSCRRRGKKCDETKPVCHACVRLSLECIYGTELQFKNFGGKPFQPPSQARVLQKAVPSPRTPLCTAPESRNLESGYLNHFISHVRHLLPVSSFQLMDRSLGLPYLQPAVLCIAASNLSMLNAEVRQRALLNDPRRSVFSPSVNTVHHIQAERYHQQALKHCRSTKIHSEEDAPAVLAAYTLLAYYHHASTDHLKFRHAVWDTVRFVSRNTESLTRSNDGFQALQMWHRLCVSHRLGKPPALLLEGEGGSTFGPNRYPDRFDQLYLDCVMRMDLDDMVYDILIKTIEIRTRLVVFRCVAGSSGLSELRTTIGSTAHEVFNKLLGRHGTDDEREEARSSFVRGSHLQGLLDVQRQRLQVWKTRLQHHQLPEACPPFQTHRDAMNALYSLLCEIMFEEFSSDTLACPSHDLANTIMRIINTLDFSTSSTADIYTFSLTELLLQFVQVYRSNSLFEFILDMVWPNLEIKSRGYEHSHYPTHLAKRIIALLAEYWALGRAVLFALPAVPDDVGKQKLLDIYHPVDLVICGLNGNQEGYFIEKVALS